MEKTSEPFCAEDKETEKKMEHSGRQGKMGEVFDKKRDFFINLGGMYIHPGKFLVKQARDARRLLNFASAK